MRSYYVILKTGEHIATEAKSKNEAVDVVCEEEGIDRADVRKVRRVEPEA
jgi:hypothetical protein